jgi:hypothetical protein
MFIGVNAGDRGKKNPMNLQNGLVRHEFLEIMLRAALKKCFDSGEAESEEAAVHKFHLDIMKPYEDYIL